MKIGFSECFYSTIDMYLEDKWPKIINFMKNVQEQAHAALNEHFYVISDFERLKVMFS